VDLAPFHRQVDAAENLALLGADVEVLDLEVWHLPPVGSRFRR
jgi:hypothetical protein